MLSKRSLAVAALLLLVGAVLVVGVGASQSPSTNVPAGGIVESPNAYVPTTPRQAVPVAPKLPAANGPVLFQDDFAGGLNGWQPAAGSTTVWVAKNGTLQQSLDDVNTSTDEDAVLAATGVSLDRGVLEGEVYPTSGSPVGLVFGGSGSGYYRVVLSANLPNSAPKAVLEKIASTGGKTLASAPLSAYSGYKLETWQLISVAISGNTISVSVDGKQVLQATDPAYAAGWAGVWTASDQGAQFDNVRIQQATTK